MTPSWISSSRDYDPFLVFEGKRLPAPSRDREREYVTGGKARTGGIQRFKLGLHGAKLTAAAMIGYIQAESAHHWFETINSWMRQLAASDCRGEWDAAERLNDYTPDKAQRTATCQSFHSRVSAKAGRAIRLYHVWVVM